MIAPPALLTTASIAAQRSAIRRIELNLVGMTADPDLHWTDVTDANSTTEQHRKFQLVGEVTPRNAGMVGTQDL